MTMKVAVIGNCQAEGVAKCLAAMLPNAEVWQAHWGLLHGAEALEAVARRAGEADIVFSQFAAWDEVGPLKTKDLRERARKLVIYPKFHFSGLQPDAIWLNKKRARSPVGSSFHSKLILGAYLLGFPQAHTVSAFNAYFYALLGYFDEYEKAVAFNIASAREQGVDLAGNLDAWRSSVFMHAPNHPKIEVLWAIAQAAAHKAGLETHDNALPDDPLEHAPQWPVYPEIAERLGIEGALEFRLRLEGEAPSFYRIEQVVKRAYLNYQDADREWLAKVPDIAHTMSVLRSVTGHKSAVATTKPVEAPKPKTKAKAARK